MSESERNEKPARLVPDHLLKEVEKFYSITIAYSPEDKGYVATVPDLKYCSAFGETPEEALTQGLEARKAYLESLIAYDQPLPGPPGAEERRKRIELVDSVVDQINF